MDRNERKEIVAPPPAGSAHPDQAGYLGSDYERDLLMFLAGVQYATRDRDMILSRINLCSMPETLSPLFAALSKEDAETVIAWFASRGAKIEGSVRAPEAALNRLQREYQHRMAQKQIKMLQFAAHRTPEDVLRMAKDVIRILEEHGIQDTPPPTEAK